MSESTVRYALITPARNEAAFIEQTVQSVIGQTLKPVKWLVISDGSTDATDEIVKKYLPANPWIELVRLPERKERSFGGKARAFNTGYATFKNLTFDVIGNLDADISIPDKEYFEFLMRKFESNPRLGLAGTPFVEDNRTYDYRFASVEHVSGACQLFRRECFEAIGGYRLLKSGGIDLTACLAVRMSGWQTQTFLEKTILHHRDMGSATRGRLAQRYYEGRMDYFLGAHPLWESCRATARMVKPPFLLGGLYMSVGYLWPLLLRRPRYLEKEMVAFRQKDQMNRLRVIVRRAMGLAPGAADPLAGPPLLKTAGETQVGLNKKGAGRRQTDL